WTIATFTPEFNKKIENYIDEYRKYYQNTFNRVVSARESEMAKLESGEKAVKLNDLKNKYYNESLADLVKNINEKDRIIEHQGRLYQQINPVFVDPQPTGPLDYRAHFFAPKKNLLGGLVSTYLFNNLVIWLMTAVLYGTLFFELLRKLVNSFEQIPGKLKRVKAPAVKKD